MDRNGHFSRTKIPLLQRANKSKLLSLSLKRIIYKKIANSWDLIKKYSHRYSKRLQRMERLSALNNQICLLVAWERIKSYARSQKSKDRLLKDILILAKRIQKLQLKESFSKLHQNVQESNGQAFHKLHEVKKVLMRQCLKRLCTKIKKSSFSQLKSHMSAGRQNTRIMVINTIINGAERKYILYAWSRLLSLRGEIDGQLNEQVEILNVQIQDLKVQVENKNSNISRLQNEIVELRQNLLVRNESPDKSYLLNSSFGNKNGNLNRSRSKIQNSSFDKDSNDGSFIREGSFGSLLGNSFFSYRSRGSNSVSKLQQCACNSCGYQQKAQKLKAANDTLKKQLEIIKTQLDFTKDMNEHLENQMKNQLKNEQRQNNIQKLRNQLRQSYKQRQILREKALKYEKYISKLKLEFKNKIQQIYRKVKKSS